MARGPHHHLGGAWAAAGGGGKEQVLVQKGAHKSEGKQISECCIRAQATSRISTADLPSTYSSPSAVAGSGSGCTISRISGAGCFSRTPERYLVNTSGTNSTNLLEDR